MVRQLYVFVDESGHYAEGRYYSVATCWCISDTSPRHVLENARGRLARDIQRQRGFDTIPSELKGSSLPSAQIGRYLELIESYAYNDGTVDSPPYPWDRDGQPLRCSRHRLNPELATEILSDFLPNPDAPKALQQLALARVLGPLTHNEKLDANAVERIRLIPDAEVWQTPAERVRELLAEMNGVSIEVETRDSAATPGIQVADLMAYASRAYAKEGDCSEAHSYLSSIDF
jgi:hypothetical protein